jgi:ABC-type transporter Mla subunit MlaD
MTEIRLSAAMRAGVLIAGAVLLLMAGGIFAQLLVLQDSNDRIHAQDAKIGELRSDVEPILDTLRPLLADTRPVLREARQLAGPLSETADDVSAALEPAPRLIRGVLALVGRSLPVVDSLQATLPEVRGVLPELATLLPELRSLLPQATEFLGEAERRRLLRRADAAISATLHLESLQSRSLRVVRRQLAIQEETLAVQLKALEHVESLDRKTGGEFPPGDG